MYLLKDIKSALEVIKEPLQLEELVRVHRTDRTDRTLLHLGGGAVLVLEVADDRGHHSVLLCPRSRTCGLSWLSLTGSSARKLQPRPSMLLMSACSAGIS